MEQIKYLDLFAGAGGLSEGFIRAGCSPVAHVEMDAAASYTLRTRAAYHWLMDNSQPEYYYDYLQGKIDRDTLYAKVPAETIRNVINQKIGKNSIKEIFSTIDFLLAGRKLDLIIGGPPCQAYSLVGRSSDKNKMRDDARCYLYCFYVEFLRKYRPKFFVFENVIGLLSAKDSLGVKYFDVMQKAFRDAGYEMEYNILSADDFGVLQKRRRIIIVGRRGKRTGFYPDLKKNTITNIVNDLLVDLPQIKAGEGSLLGQDFFSARHSSPYLTNAHIATPDAPLTFHCARPQMQLDLEIYEYIARKWNQEKIRVSYDSLPEHMQTRTNLQCFRDRYKVVAGEAHACHTIIAHIAKDGHYYIHPDISQNRSLTPREAARIQSFPDDYFFETVSGVPGRGPAFRQIGNAVPVLLAEQIAKKLLEDWK